MNKNELKKVLKPVVKQCINEVLLEEGLLSTVIAEVMKGTGAARIVEATKPVQPKVDNTAAREKKRKQMLEQKRKLLNAIGTESYNGVNLFEGTTPTTSAPFSSSIRESTPVPHPASNILVPLKSLGSFSIIAACIFSRPSLTNWRTKETGSFDVSLSQASLDTSLK